MLDFHPLRLEDLPKLRQFFGYSRSRICDTTPGTVLIWRDIYKTEWAVYGGSLYFKVDYPGLGPTFTLPLGGGRPEHFRQIADYCCRRNMPIAFYPVPKDELEQLQDFFPASTAVGERNNFDYLYRAEDLQYFRGKKLSGQRNHVNKFLKTYGSWSFEDLTQEQVPEVLEFLDRYAAGREKAVLTGEADLDRFVEVMDVEGWRLAELPEDLTQAGSFTLWQEETAKLFQGEKEAEMWEICTFQCYEDGDYLTVDTGLANLNITFAIPQSAAEYLQSLLD